MRIGCLQFSPQVGDTENNLNRADSVLSKANPEDLDLLVLPELAFSGTLSASSKEPHRIMDCGIGVALQFLDGRMLMPLRI